MTHLHMPTRRASDYGFWDGVIKTKIIMLLYFFAHQPPPPAPTKKWERAEGGKGKYMHLHTMHMHFDSLVLFFGIARTDGPFPLDKQAPK